MTSKTRIKQTFSNLPSFFSDDGIEDIDELIDYLNHLKSGNMTKIQMTILKAGLPLSDPDIQADLEVYFSAIKYIPVSDEEFLSNFGINSDNQQEIYEVLKSKLGK